MRRPKIWLHDIPFSHDTWVNNRERDENYGDDPIMRWETYYVAQGIMRLEPWEIPAHIELYSKIEVHFYVTAWTKGEDGAGVELVLYGGPGVQWYENTLTWNTRFGIGSLIQIEDIIEPPAWTSFQLKTWAEYFNGLERGFWFYKSDYNGGIFVASSEYQDHSKRPFLRFIP